MERKLWIGLIVILSMILTTVSGPAVGAQLAINSIDPMLYGRPIANQIASQWTGDVMGNFSGFDPSGEIIAWEPKKMGMETAPNFKSRPQWFDISNNTISSPSDTTALKILQSPSSVWTHNWAAEVIFSNNNFFSSKDSKTKEEVDTSGLPPLPNALWLCGFGIMGILCVRRTNDHSNVS